MDGYFDLDDPECWRVPKGKIGTSEYMSHTRGSVIYFPIEYVRSICNTDTFCDGQRYLPAIINVNHNQTLQRYLRIVHVYTNEYTYHIRPCICL